MRDCGIYFPNACILSMKQEARSALRAGIGEEVLVFEERGERMN